MPLRVGAHMSISGGVDKAIERAVACGCEALQIFVKSSNQWAARPLTAEEVSRFRAGVLQHKLGPVICHDSYLINVGSPDPALWAKSRKALEEEYRRCTELGIQYLVMHPGAHVGSGEEAAFEKIAAAVEQVFAAVPDSQVEILLENTAGQGSNVGWSFEHLQQIIERIKSRARVGVCFDTCHAFAAGYDLTTQAGWDETWSEFDRLVGLGRLKAFHINDSKKGLGSRVDRHEQIGLGQMGVTPFFLLMNDPRFENLVAAIETEYTDDGRENQQNLAVLRWLHGKTAVPTQAQLEAVRQRA